MSDLKGDSGSMTERERKRRIKEAKRELRRLEDKQHKIECKCSELIQELIVLTAPDRP